MEPSGSELPDELKPVLRTGLPAYLATCSAAGVPNATFISQAYWVDRQHVALSFQFFNKTVRNVRENPRAALCLNDPAQLAQWVLDLEFDHSETDGPIFDEMDMQIEAIASATGMQAREVEASLNETAQRVENNRNNPTRAAAEAKQGLSRLMEKAKSSGALQQKAEEVKPEATKAAWITLGALVLSLLAAVLGAMTGRRHSREVRPTP